MMKDKKNIDKIIAGKAKSFGQTPPPEIWDGILAELHPKKKRLIPVFWRYAAGFVLLAGLSGLLYYSFNHSSESLKSDYTSDIPETKTITGESGTTVKNAVPLTGMQNSREKHTTTSSERKNLSAETNGATITEVPLIPRSQHLTKKTVSQEEIINPDIAGSNFILLSSIIIPEQINPDDIKNDRIKEQNLSREYTWEDLQAQEEEIPEDRKHELSISAIMSPLYSYRDISGTNASAFNETESGKISYSGGMEIGYKASRRLSIHTGLVYSKLGFAIEGVANAASPADVNWLSTKSYKPRSGNNLLINNSIGNITGQNTSSNLSNKPSGYESSGNISLDYLNSGGLAETSGNLIDENLNLNQFLYFMEVPFNLRYTIIDRDMNVNLVGGLSTNILIGNRVLLVEENSSEYIGKTNSISNVNYTGNIGFGFNYNLNQNLHFLFEPQFKYYLNSINEDNLISNRPYSIGIYTGIRYLFR